MTTEMLLPLLEQNTERLFALLRQFSDENFHTKASENDWSAAQLTEHLWKVDVTALRALHGQTIAASRPPDQKIATIQFRMEEDTKRSAPEPVRPAEENASLGVLLDQIHQTRAALRNEILTSDLTVDCIAFKHPALGTLTKMEWIAFVLYHAERHLKQLRGMAAGVSA